MREILTLRVKVQLVYDTLEARTKALHQLQKELAFATTSTGCLGSYTVELVGVALLEEPAK